MRNDEIAALFREMADLLELENANPFRVRAYRNAASTLEELSRPVSDLIEEGSDLTELRGIGADLAETLSEIVSTGSFGDLERRRESSTGTLRDLLQVPGLGPKRVQALHDELGIATLEDLQAALESNAIERVSGFGSKTARSLRETMLSGRRKKQRRLWADIEPEAVALEAFVRGIEGVDQSAVGGSFRRKRETVADLDAVASSRSAADVIERFVDYYEIASVVSQGTTRASVLLKSGLSVDLRVVEPESYGSALMYFTGSRDHQLRLRDMAIEQGWKLNEYGLFEGDRSLAGATEEEVYRQFGLAYIEPELRESRGEIEAARSGRLPNLIALEDIRGDTHVSPSSSDEPADIRGLARAAIERGYSYLVVADRVGRDGGALTASQMRVQAQEIALIDEELEDIRLLAGAVIEILEDGSLAVDIGQLGELDLVICVVAGGFDVPRAKQTARLLRAIEESACQVLAHPTGRLINERGPLDFDVEWILTAARDAGCAIELDGDPRRLDLPDRYCQMARDIGTKLVVTSNATSTAELDNIRFGIGQARRGWLEKGDVLNTLPIDEFRAALRRSG